MTSRFACASLSMSRGVQYLKTQGSQIVGVRFLTFGV